MTLMGIHSTSLPLAPSLRPDELFEKIDNITDANIGSFISTVRMIRIALRAFASASLAAGAACFLKVTNPTIKLAGTVAAVAFAIGSFIGSFGWKDYQNADELKAMRGEAKTMNFQALLEEHGWSNLIEYNILPREKLHEKVSRDLEEQSFEAFLQQYSWAGIQELINHKVLSAEELQVRFRQDPAYPNLKATVDKYSWEVFDTDVADAHDFTTQFLRDTIRLSFSEVIEEFGQELLFIDLGCDQQLRQKLQLESRTLTLEEFHAKFFAPISLATHIFPEQAVSILSHQFDKHMESKQYYDMENAKIEKTFSAERDRINNDLNQGLSKAEKTASQNSNKALRFKEYTQRHLQQILALETKCADTIRTEKVETARAIYQVVCDSLKYYKNSSMDPSERYESFNPEQKEFLNTEYQRMVAVVDKAQARYHTVIDESKAIYVSRYSDAETYYNAQLVTIERVKIEDINDIKNRSHIRQKQNNLNKVNHLQSTESILTNSIKNCEAAMDEFRTHLLS